MKLEDEKLIEINNQLLTLQKQKNKIENDTKDSINDVNLTRKQSLIFVLFFSCFSVFLYFISVSLFDVIELNIANKVDMNLNESHWIASLFSTSSFCVFYLYFIWCSKKIFKDTFSSLSTIVESFFITLLLTGISGGSIGSALFVIKYFIFPLNSSSMSFQSLDNIFFFTILACFIIAYIIHFSKDLFKNKTEQSKFIENKRQNYESSLMITDEQIENFRKEVLDSFHSIEDLAYLSFISKSENLEELLKIIDTIEEDVVKKDGYDSLFDYEKDILINNIEKNKTLIHNN